MEPGHKLDALVEERIFGTRVAWVRPRSLLSLEIVETDADDPEGRPIRADLADGARSMAELLVRPYSGDIAAGWLVIEEMRARHYLVEIEEHSSPARAWRVTLYGPAQAPMRGRGASVPHAICIAALTAVGAPA